MKTEAPALPDRQTSLDIIAEKVDDSPTVRHKKHSLACFAFESSTSQCATGHVERKSHCLKMLQLTIDVSLPGPASESGAAIRDERKKIDEARCLDASPRLDWPFGAFLSSSDAACHRNVTRNFTFSCRKTVRGVRRPTNRTPAFRVPSLGLESTKTLGYCSSNRRWV